jgi:hypothetical protein
MASMVPLEMVVEFVAVLVARINGRIKVKSTEKFRSYYIILKIDKSAKIGRGRI